MLELNVKNNNHYFYSAVIFAIILISAYSPVLLLGQTFIINTPISSEYLDSQNKNTLFGIVADYGMMGIWPDLKLASKMVSEGELPLWNPYVGIGYPLGADTTDHIFSPISLSFLLPTTFWDVSLLLVLWVAGFSMYLFLRNLGLNFSSSLCGGIFYMLSGSFTWFMSHPGPFVIMTTPLILYSIDKVLKNKNPKYVVLLSLSFSLSILGAHLQSLFLQFLVVMLYLFYRLISSFLIDKTSVRIYTFKQKLTIIRKSSFRIFIGLLGGFGLASFFIFYVLEFLKNGILNNSLHYDTVQYNPLSIANSFIPYILGNITRTWTTNTEWNSPFGYSGIFVLFFLVLSINYLKHKSYSERFTPIFFLLISFFALMRLVNVPIISALHSLPIFNLISFGSYSGVLIILGFSVSAAFGINYLSNTTISRKTLSGTLIVALFLMLITLIPVFIEFFSEQHLSHFIDKSDIQNYILFQIVQAIFFLSTAYIISIVLIKKTYLIVILPLFAILEMSLYLPLGLHPIWLAYKFVLVAISMILLIILTRFCKIGNSRNKIIFWSCVMILMIGIFVGSVVISEKSPYGMPTRQNYFEDNNITTFLQDNLEHQRMFSFETTMRADYNGGFDISSVGQHSSFLVNDYYTFSKLLLDEDQSPLGLGSTPWSNIYGPEKSIDKFLEHKKYFDFLGVKYIITQGYNLNSVSYGVSGLAGNHVILNSKEQKVDQKFVSSVNSINSIGIFLFGINVENNDQLVLNIDTVPYTKENHRVSSISKISNTAINEFQISPPIINSQGKNVEFSLQYPNASSEKYIVLYFDEKDSSYSNIELFINEEEETDRFIPFTITPVEKNFPIPFRFHDIFINENKDAFPRAYLVHEFITVPVNTAQDFLVKNNEFDLRNEVILESMSEFKLNNLKSTTYDSDFVKILEFNENNIRVNTFSESDAILILTDVFYPGWNVLIDGEPSEILRADGLVRAVIIPEGNHIVEFNYVPNSFWFGVVISIITAVILFSVYLYSRKIYPKIVKQI